MALPAFGDLAVHEAPFADAIGQEDEWLARAAATGRPAAHLWQATRMLAVPRSYERLPGWASACATLAAAGWPVQLRRSGGGLVPLGPGVTNLSLVWRNEPAGAVEPHLVYRGLCGLLRRALARLDIAAAAQAVEGSFCDGRFNLAVRGRKIAGTAQAWRRIGTQRVVLAHAVILVSADPAALTAIANRFEQAVASGRHYRSDALTNVARAWGEARQARSAPDNLEQQLAAALGVELAAPHDAAP